MKITTLACALLISAMARPVAGPLGRRAESKVEYRVTDLGTLPDCDSTYAEAVNDTGVVVGYAYGGAGHGIEALSRPFVWRNGKLTELRKLGGEYGQACTINARGDIGGYAELADSSDRPVIWRKLKGYAPEQLNDGPGRVLSMLDDGSAVGDLIIDGKRRAAKWKAGKSDILGEDSDVEGVATCANVSGVVAGNYVPRGGFSQSVRSPGTRRAAMWKGRERVSMSTLLTDEASRPRGLPSGNSECNAVSDTGVIVGSSGFQGSARACIWKDGKCEALPGFPDAQTQAYSINRHGEIVGDAMGGRKWVACIWRNGKAADLNHLISANSGWILSVAKCISDRGNIVGYGSYKGAHWRAFLLTPITK